MKNRAYFSAISIVVRIFTITVVISTIISSAPLSWLSVVSAWGEPLTITRITPSGEDVENQSQIVIQFNRPVVPIGKMERAAHELGITITPEIKGQWRWLNPTDLALNIDATSGLTPATAYKITVNPGIMAQDGTTIAKQVIHNFVTRRPAISYYEFRTWRSPSLPVISLHFNQPVTRDSVKQALFFSLPGDTSYNNTVEVESQQERTTPKADSEAATNKSTTATTHKKTSMEWDIYPTKELPSDSKVHLIANPGIVSQLGAQKSIDTKVVVEFNTFPEFKFMGIRCYTIKGSDPIIISPEESSSGDLQHIVDPRGYTELLFTVPVNFKQIRDNVRFLPDLAQGQKSYDVWANGYNSYGLNFPHTKGELYGVAIPQYLKAWQQYSIIEKTPGIRDYFGRELRSHVDFTFYTDHRKAGYKILHETGVLEKDIDSEVPIAVTNIDNMTISYTTLTDERGNSQKETIQQKESNQKNSNQKDGKKIASDTSKTAVKSNMKIQDIAYFTPLGVREMLHNKSGAVYGKVVSTSPAVDKNKRDSQFFTVVTPWQIHAKVGHFNSLIWVTSLKTGEPVPGVTITIHKDLLENLTHNSPSIAESITDKNGIAMLPGMVVLDPARETSKDSWEYGLPRLIVKAVKDNIVNDSAHNSGDSAHNSVEEEIESSDVALLPLTYGHDFSIPAWRVSDGDVSSQTEPQYAHIHAWGTTPQGIYKAGDTIEYKIYVRDQNNDSFTTPPQSGYKLTITDPSGKNVVEQKEISLSEFSSFDGKYSVPENGAIGWYNFYLSSTFSEKGWRPLKVLVTDFTPSPFKVSTEFNGTVFKPDQTLIIDTEATLHAGGPYADAPVRVTVRLKEQLFQPDSPVTKGFIFYRSAGGEKWEPDASGAKTSDVSSGAENGEKTTSKGADESMAAPESDSDSTIAQGSGYGPDSAEDTGGTQEESESDGDSETDDIEYPSDLPEVLLEKTATLDHHGLMKNSLKLSRSTIGYGKLEVESSVQDDSGRYISNMKSARYLGRDLFVGIKSPQWVYEAGKNSMMQAIAVDGDGKPVDGATIMVAIQRRVTKASRVKGAGNAYLTQYINEWVVTEEKNLTSASEPVEFEFNPQEPGDYRIIARINQKDLMHTASIYTWVTGKGAVLWQSPDDYSLAIIPERNTFKVGETAKYLVKNPFPGAYALISVERYGVLRQWVQRLEESSQVIEVPVQPDDLPGFFLSVTIISPRVEKPPSKDDVDLGKPTFRMGYVETNVTEAGHDITLAVLPEKSTYKPGDTVRVTIHAERKKTATPETKLQPAQKSDQNMGRKEDEKIELAIAVLDEAVFDLIASGRDHFDISKGFNTLDGLDLENYSLLTNIIGRRKFEKKGANVGGDGGAGMKMRSFFKYVSYWNPSLVADASGNANIEFIAPDNLTGWKIFVIAATPTDAMGLGEGDFKVNRPTEIRPVMPNQVTASDSFQAGFSVMNRTDKPRTVNVEIKMREDDSKEGDYSGIKEDIELLPFKRKTLFLPVETKRAGTLIFTAQAKDALDGDAVTHTLKVNQERSYITVLNYGVISGNTSAADHENEMANGKSSTDNVKAGSVEAGQKSIVEHLLYPSSIYTDSGNTEVTLYPTVLGNMENAFRYMSQYPYSCWEQKLSKAVMASYFMELRDYLPATSSWSEASELPDKTLRQAVQFQAPNGGMAYFTPDNSYVCPYLSAYTALAFGWLKSRGSALPNDAELKLWDYLGTLLRKDLFPGFDSNGFYSAGMASTVRAVALAALASAGRATLDDITRYEGHLKEMSLFGKAHFLMAALKVKGGEAIAEKSWEAILSSSNQSAGKVVFSETLDTGFARILESSLRTQGAVLSAIVQYGKRSKDKKSAKEAEVLAFKLVRTITDTRGSKSAGENTQENIFCMNGLSDYSAAYERSERKGKAIEAEATLKHESNGEVILGNATFRNLKDSPIKFTKNITEADPGKSADIIISSNSAGTLYYSAGMVYAPKDDFTSPINSAMEIRREYSVEKNGRWELLKEVDGINRAIHPGDLVRVDLFLSLPAARNFPVISDPVPGGFEPVNRELATASLIDAQKADSPPPQGSWWFKLKNWQEFNESRWSFYHQELGHSAVRYYADYLSAGNYHLSYTSQAVAMGSFTAMPAQVEEMYNSDIFGKGTGEKIVVSESSAP